MTAPDPGGRVDVGLSAGDDRAATRYAPAGRQRADSAPHATGVRRVVYTSVEGADRQRGAVPQNLVSK
jgi:hypothetical protein